MIKLMGMIKRKEGMSVEDFHAYWRDVHAPMIAGSPGLRQYIQNHTVPELYSEYPPAFDGMAEAWFDDLDGFETAVASPGWQRAIVDVPNFMVGAGRIMSTEVPMIDALPTARERQSLVKYVGLLTRKPGLSVADFQNHWRDVHGPLVKAEFPEMRRYVQSHAIPSEYENGTSPSWDGIPEAWFDSLDVFPWHMVKRTGDKTSTPAALDSANTFIQPIPSLVVREVIIVDGGSLL
jgi:uncharacterized protein (TIGR02118 family)